MPSQTEQILNRAETILAQCIVAANEAAQAAAIVSGAAPVDSPAFTGHPTAPTQQQSDNSTKLATTAYIDGQKGAALGVASLDSSGHIPTAQLPASVLGGLTFLGLWNANTNSPHLTSGSGTPGDFYVVNVAGSTSLDGISSWAVGDWAVFQTSTWGKVPAYQSPPSNIPLTALAPLAAHTFVANATGGSAAPTAINAATATAELNAFGGDSGGGGTKGLVPAPAAGDAAANKYLKASGAFATIPTPDLSPYATINSPALTGTPTAPTQARDSNSTSLATTAYVTNQLSDAGDGNPSTDGVASRGTSAHAARSDHVHPTDTSRAPLDSPALTGTPTAPTPSGGDNSTKIATTAFVQGISTSPFPAGTRMLFQQTAAPTGWTKDTTHNDKALRIVNGTVGSGGNVAFSTAFGRTETDGHVLTVTEMPSHRHAAAAVTQEFTPTPGGPNATINVLTPTGYTDYQGGNGAHTHGIDVRVLYVDVIIASKN